MLGRGTSRIAVAYDSFDSESHSHKAKASQSTSTGWPSRHYSTRLPVPRPSIRYGRAQSSAFSARGTSRSVVGTFRFAIGPRATRHARERHLTASPCPSTRLPRRLPNGLLLRAYTRFLHWPAELADGLESRTTLRLTGDSPRNLGPPLPVPRH